VTNQNPDSKDLKNYYHNLLNLGDTYAALKADKCFDYFNRVRSFALKKTNYDSIYLASILNRGIAHLLVNQRIEAKKHLQKALELSTERQDSAMSHIELAKLYLLDSTQYALAETHAKQALNQCLDYPKGHVVLAEIYTVLGQIYLKTKQLEQAKKAFQDALGDLNAKNYPANPSNWQIEALSQLADLQTPSEASRTYETLSECLYRRKSFFKTDAAKLNLTQQARTIYQKSIGLNHQLFGKTQDNKYLNRILTDMERSKAVLLSELIQDTRIKSYYDVPDTVRTQERHLKLAVAQAERKTKQDTSDFQKSSLDLSTKYGEWQTFVQQLKQAYPNYYRFKHAEPQVLDIQTLQNQLPDGSLLVDYYLNEKTL
jgi:tetratricopeptide (TPR) repeat protein